MIYVIVHLYVRHTVSELQAYEHQVMPILSEHGATLISAFRPEGQDVPDEIHVIQFPSRQSYDDYREDERVIALRTLRENVIKLAEIYISDELIDYSNHFGLRE